MVAKAQIRLDATAPVGSGPASKDDRVRDQPSPGATGYGRDGGTGTMHDRGSSSHADATQRHACPIRPSHYIQASHDLESGRTQDSNHSHVASMTGSVPVDANFGGNPSPIHMFMTMPGELRCDAYMCDAARLLTQTHFEQNSTEVEFNLFVGPPRPAPFSCATRIERGGPSWRPRHLPRCPVEISARDFRFPKS